VVLSCIDSRTSAELIFDQGLGDIFSVRIAGNIINEDILGSMEFACKLAGSKIIVVLGHSKCGAVKGACDHAEMGNLTALISVEKARDSLQRPANYLVNPLKQYVYTMNEQHVTQIQSALPQHSVIYIGSEQGFSLSGIPRLEVTSIYCRNYKTTWTRQRKSSQTSAN
jgi:carbonic anhydrase